MGILQDAGVTNAYHFTPLHYLPFIAGSACLKSKPSLIADGFAASHLRSMSNAQDVSRGFGAYTHLTTDPAPRILRAKLAAGFPHIGLSVPISHVDAADYSLCRFNVAMTRFLRRGGKKGFPESPTNGRYYEGHQIPIARGSGDKRTMLNWHLRRGTMIEILVHGDFALPDKTELLCYSKADEAEARAILDACGQKWTTRILPAPGPYPSRSQHRKNVQEFVIQALKDPKWRGNGLEFDRV